MKSLSAAIGYTTHGRRNAASAPPFLRTRGPHGGPLFASLRWLTTRDARWKRLIGQGVYHTSKGPTVGRAKGRGRRQQPSRKLEGKYMAEKMRYNKIIDLLE